MRSRSRQVVGVIAIYLVALHVALAGFRPADAGGAPAGPGFVICHSDSAGVPSRHSDGDGPGTDSCCDHCDLCNALATPPPPDASHAHDLAPTPVLDVLHPLSTAARLSLSRSPKLARGPPSTA